MEPRFYARPDGEPAVLRESPRLSSWKRAGETAHGRLARAMDQAQEVAAPFLAGIDGPAALRLDIGLHPSTPLLDQRDLDNFLIPLVLRVEGGLSGGIVSAWASKHYDDRSLLRIEAARPGPTAPDLMLSASSSTGPTEPAAPSTSTAFMQEIRDQLAGLDPLPEGPVTLELAFVVGPSRNWIDLWKPTIDALGPLIGESLDGRSWHPQDGRIVDLGLHRTLDRDLGDEVRIGLTATPGQRGADPESGLT